MRALKHQLRRFRDQEDGLVMTEFLIMLPLLVWTFMALFIYWDAFRTINEAQKAAYSVSDLISRQSTIDAAWVDGMQSTTEYLMSRAPNVRMRITSVKYKEADDSYYVLFSRSPGNKMPQLNSAGVKAMQDRIPIMADQNSVVIVETEVSYDPAFNVGIPDHTFDNFIVTRPRNDLQVCFVGLPCPALI